MYKLKWKFFMSNRDQEFDSLEDALQFMLEFFNSDDENGINGGWPESLECQNGTIEQSDLLAYCYGEKTITQIQESIK